MKVEIPLITDTLESLVDKKQEYLENLGLQSMPTESPAYVDAVVNDPEFRERQKDLNDYLNSFSANAKGFDILFGAHDLVKEGHVVNISSIYNGLLQAGVIAHGRTYADNKARIERMIDQTTQFSGKKESMEVAAFKKFADSVVKSLDAHLKNTEQAVKYFVQKDLIHLAKYDEALKISEKKAKRAGRKAYK